jgi:sortase A
MLLKTGIVAMTFALAFAAAVAFFALRDEPTKVVASQTKAPASPSAPLARSYPPELPEDPPSDKVGEPLAVKEAAAEPRPAARPEPQPRPEPEREPLQGEGNDWPMPTEEQLRKAGRERHYELPDGAIMGLTINALGLHNVPVFNSDSGWALDNGVSHEPGTSLPWSRSEQRNVYLQGHRLGWPGTDSHLVFYHLSRLDRGDEISLKNRDGKKFRYKVSETFIVEPNDSWVMGRVRGRDMVTLQTCTPIPTFEKRLIVRADRV